MSKQKKNVSFWFNPNKDAFATVTNPEVSHNVDVTNGNIVVMQPECKDGLCLSFPIDDFEVKDRSCIRNFKSFVKQLSQKGRNFYMEISEELLGGSDKKTASLWCIGYDQSRGVIGITWD